MTAAAVLARRLAAALLIAATGGALLAAPARAGTSASIAPSLYPDRLHARASLTITIRFANGESGVPAPLDGAVLRLPAGLTLNIPSLRSCTAKLLIAHGAAGCPRQSRIGSGHARVEGTLGSSTPVIEDTALHAFLGPPLNDLQPTFEILGEARWPLGAAMILTAKAAVDRAPYGEALEMSVPSIPTVANEPDASVVEFSLTIGTATRHRGGSAPSVAVPTRCPVGGLPFAAAFIYADGSTSDATATVPCPT